MLKTIQYRRLDGSVPFEEWFNSLSAAAAVKVRAAVAQMNQGNLGDHKSVGTGVWERRINFEQGYRIYYGVDGPEIVLLLHGGTKSRQQNDIDYAKLLWLEYKSRRKQDLLKKQTEAKNESSFNAKRRRKKR